eukprot:TRINITY_DN31229_c0_g1_i1.p1 TRINITY_DN31229_c0_g1~~TRINITY_DN31229_c0_g1_i1.p1  ORF type:complete len:268 (+),score=68.93 TRINITY_DN31229_c0_g1_i1:64-867(+)
MISQVLEMVTQQGGEFWKYHYRQVGPPTRTHLQILVDEEDAGRDCIVWKDVGDKDWVASVTLCEIVDVRKGPTSRTFQDNVLGITNPLLCFSIHTRGRTLDIEAVHPEDFRVWMTTLAYLLDGDASFSQVDAPEGSIFHYDAETHLSGLMQELGQHVEHSDAPLESIAAWVAQQRLASPGEAPGRRSKRIPDPVEALDVNQMLLAGGFRIEVPPGAQPLEALPKPSRADAALAISPSHPATPSAACSMQSPPHDARHVPSSAAGRRW